MAEEVIVVEGTSTLSGEVAVSGAKNSALKLIAAALLGQGACTIHNVPLISDIEVMSEVLRGLGARVERKDHSLLVDTSAAGCPPGTLVEVHDLFCNVPARRKFLRSVATEEGRVKGVFTVHALAHPGIGFSLTVDGREIYRLAPAATLADRLLDERAREHALRRFLRQAAAREVEKLLVANMPDRGAVVARHIIFVAQDDGHRLVLHAFVHE